MNLIERFTQFALLGAEWVMYLLVGLSIISVMIMVERAIYYASRKGDSDALLAKIKRALGDGDRDKVMKDLAADPSMEAAVAREGLREADRGAGAAGEAMQGVRGRERQGQEKNLVVLGTIGNNAPFIGLFGTVIGIIGAFDKLGANTKKAAAAAAAGAAKENTSEIMRLISEALVATAIGLLVALPAVAAYNYFQRRVKGNVAKADSIAHAILGELKARDEQRAPAREAKAAD